MTHFRQADYRVRHFSFSFSELFRQIKIAWASPGGNHRNTRWIPRRKREKELLFAALRGSIMG
jgi:hypothetical protein